MRLQQRPLSVLLMSVLVLLAGTLLLLSVGFYIAGLNIAKLLTGAVLCLDLVALIYCLRRYMLNDKILTKGGYVQRDEEPVRFHINHIQTLLFIVFFGSTALYALLH